MQKGSNGEIFVLKLSDEIVIECHYPNQQQDESDYGIKEAPSALGEEQQDGVQHEAFRSIGTGHVDAGEREPLDEMKATAQQVGQATEEGGEQRIQQREQR